MPKDKKVLNLERLLWADKFEKFCATKFNTSKRFGLEGCDSFVPGLKTAMDALA